MAQRIAGRFVVAAEEIDVKDVLPGTSAHGARLDLAQADVAQGEDAERFEERAGSVLNLEGNRRLIRAFGNHPPKLPRGFSNEKKSGEVFLVVLDARLQDFSRVLSRRLPSGDSGGVFSLLRDHMLHAAGCVVERHSLNLRMAPEKISALIERDRMGQDFPDRTELHPRRGDYVVNDAQQVFALNHHVAGNEEVGVLGDRSCKRVSMGMTAASTDPFSTRSKTSAERAHGTTAHRGSIFFAAS